MAGALGALMGEQVEVEKRDAPEYETMNAREEVEIGVSLFVIHIQISLFFIRGLGLIRCNFRISLLDFFRHANFI